MNKLIDQVNEIIEQTKLNKLKLNELRGLV